MESDPYNLLQSMPRVRSSDTAMPLATQPDAADNLASESQAPAPTFYSESEAHAWREMCELVEKLEHMLAALRSNEAAHPTKLRQTEELLLSTRGLGATVRPMAVGPRQAWEFSREVWQGADAMLGLRASLAVQKFAGAGNQLATHAVQGLVNRTKEFHPIMGLASEAGMNACGLAGQRLAKLCREAVRPGTWVRDEEITSCGCGGHPIGPEERLSHCRNCGLGVCQRHSAERWRVPWQGWDRPVRVCDRCTELVRKRLAAIELMQQVERLMEERWRTAAAEAVEVPVWEAGAEWTLLEEDEQSPHYAKGQGAQRKP